MSIHSCTSTPSVPALKCQFWFARLRDLKPVEFRRVHEGLISKASSLWFHDEISRDECEARLAGYCDGAFLVRQSKNFPGDFVLCVLHEDQVQYYRIRKSKVEDAVVGLERIVYSLDNEDFFHDLESLVLHYQSDADGLCCKLM